YGKLYNWYAVGDSLICPDGWHIPSIAEWEALFNIYGGFLTAGDNLIDTLGFDLIYAGIRFVTGEFQGAGDFTQFWTSTERDAGTAWAYDIYTGNALVHDVYLSKNNGLSCRCIKD
ncbi:MAG: FISUMP domain-containing protein, partial [Chitinophagales bacterium]